VAGASLPGSCRRGRKVGPFEILIILLEFAVEKPHGTKIKEEHKLAMVILARGRNANEMKKKKLLPKGERRGENPTMAEPQTTRQKLGKNE